MSSVELLLIGVGGVAGALTRFGVGQIVGRYFSPTFPLATFLINVTGSSLLGFSAAHIEGLPIGQVVIERYGFQIGFLGAYTTYATFTYESIRMVEEGKWKKFFTYVVGSMVVGLLCCDISYIYGRG